MAKTELQTKAKSLRKKGESVKSIARSLGVSRGSVSLWTRDIELTSDQLAKLQANMQNGAAIGRLKSAKIHKEKRKQIAAQAIQEGMDKLGQMSERELLMAGLALYWGEGCKKKHGVEFCNSDPKMVQFLINWLKYCFKVPQSSIWARVGINIAHKEREEIVRKYWSTVSGIPLSQFTKTSLKIVVSKKVYENMDQHFGTLTIRVSKPGALYSKIIGLIEGLYLVEQEGFGEST